MHNVFLLHRVISLGQVLVDGGLDLSDKRGIFDRAGCVTQKLGMEWIFVATSIGLRACTTCSAFEMSVSFRVQMSVVLFLTLMKEHRTEWNFH